ERGPATADHGDPGAGHGVESPGSYHRCYRMARMRLPLLAALAATLAAAAHTEVRRIPFWPEPVRAAIQQQVDGVAALETVRAVGRFHRVHGSPGFAAAAEYLRDRLRAVGLDDAVIEHFPADGETRYGHFRSYLGWTPQEAVLEETSPRAAIIAR